jgi:predicted ribosome quality control (RQC) complex YloA/Tae2 family protein
MSLRKRLVGGKILDVKQHEFERIVTLEIKTALETFSLIIEAFKRGNLILADSSGRIVLALNYVKMRDRNIIRGEVFKHAPLTGLNPLKVTYDDLSKLRNAGPIEVVKALVDSFAIGGLYAEEILSRAGIDKKTPVNNLSDAQLDAIYNSLKTLTSALTAEKMKPCIVLDENGKPIDVTPFPLTTYEGFKLNFYASFNEASDIYFSELAAEMEEGRLREAQLKRLDELKRILSMQEKRLRDLNEAVVENRKIGDVIYMHLNEIKQLIDGILQRKLSGKNWDEIKAYIDESRQIGKKPEAYVKNIEPEKMRLVMSIDNVEFTLNLKRKPQLEAAEYYRKARRARDKLAGLEKSIEEIKMKLKGIAGEVKKAPPLRKKPERAWYEKFHWANSSEGYLIIAGKDAGTNELLIKRHMEPHDLAFHADIHGAPFVLIKTSGRMPGQKTIIEAAQMAASYSKAWKQGLNSIDVFWVKPEQISKKAPSGEFLGRGMFMIHGPRNYLKGVELRLAIGIAEHDGQVKVIGGPTSAIKNQTQVYVEIAPGKIQAAKLARQIIYKLYEKAPEKLKESIRKIEVADVQNFIPAGKGNLTNI